MANILDILSTHTGGRLLDRSSGITGLNEKELVKAFSFSLPALLSFVHFDKSSSKDLVDFIENGDLVDEGQKFMESLLDKEQIETLYNFNSLLKIPEKEFSEIMKISFGVLALLIGQILERNEMSKVENIIASLSGRTAEFDQDLIAILVKNQDDAGLIDSAEEIALGRKKDDDDQSILGGYAGGR